MAEPFIVNARMYAVTPAVEAAWQALLADILALAAIDPSEAQFVYHPYPAPQPLEVLWRRLDVGVVQMCGYPIALGLADVTPIAAPIPAAPWADGRPVYRSDLIVRTDAPYRRLEDSFSGRLGWTVSHSQSGFNALRHHLLAHRTPDRPRLYAAVTGDLITARRILDGVRDGTIDIGPLDAYWHLLIGTHAPELTKGVRTLESTDTVTIPPFVAGPHVPASIVEKLRDAFARAAAQPWFAERAHPLAITGFAPVTRADFAKTLRWHEEALAAGYPEPA
jgi:ABC-type phosphate/phosphonate transport system substrate-binding protein